MLRGIRKLLAAGIAGAAMLSGASFAAEPVPIVASFSILADLVRVVGGERVRVTTLVGPDEDAHVFEPKPGDAKALVQSRLLVINGLSFEPWAQKLAKSAGYQGETVVASKGVKIVNLSMQDVYVRSNYQDFQRYQAVDLSINGDAQASLPALTEQVMQLMTPDRRRMAEERAAAHGEQARKTKDALRESAARGWEASPVTTARLAMETYDVIRNEPWALVVSDRIPWARSLWPATRHHQFLGGSGGQGVGYGAPAAVGAALANRDKGLLSVTFQPDGDLMYAPGVLWTAAHHKIPLLMVMHNNRGYHQEVMHLQRMAALHRRRPDTALIGNEIDNPAIDYAKLAQAHGVWAEGPISDPKLLRPALVRALAVVKSGRPALLDVVCQPR